jgi:putative solute:sodium symporter small subunit
MPPATDDSPACPAGAAAAAPSAARRELLAWYWRWTTRWTLIGLAAWLVLTVGVAWFARDLDRWTVAHVPAGYWWAAQGAIGGFLVIIVVYCLVMEQLEERVHAEGAESGSTPGASRHG